MISTRRAHRILNIRILAPPPPGYCPARAMLLLSLLSLGQNGGSIPDLVIDDRGVSVDCALFR